MEVESSETSSNWVLSHWSLFFLHRIHSTCSPLLLANVPGKSALAICFPVLRLTSPISPYPFFSFFHESHRHVWNIIPVLAHPSFGHVYVPFSDLAEVTLLTAFSSSSPSFTRYLPTKSLAVTLFFHLLPDVISPTRNFRHKPILAWCIMFCNETYTHSWLPRRTWAFQVFSEGSF